MKFQLVSAKPRIFASTSSPSTGRKFSLDRKSTRLNSSHLGISYAVFCLKKKKPALTSRWRRRRWWGCARSRIRGEFTRWRSSADRLRAHGSTRRGVQSTTERGGMPIDAAPRSAARRWRPVSTVAAVAHCRHSVFSVPRLLPTPNAVALFLMVGGGTMLILGGTLSRFFFNDTATTEIYTLSLHDALPI